MLKTNLNQRIVMGQISVVKAKSKNNSLEKLLCLANSNYLFEHFRIGEKIKQTEINYNLLTLVCNGA